MIKYNVVIVLNVCVIGGGASGTICAIRLARRGINVKILEKNSNILKKVLLTGNGKCNYFNSDININHYRSSNIDFLDKIFNKNNINNVLDFFDSIGVIPRIKNGYYYPYSNTSTTIKNLLLIECKRLNIEIINDILVTDIIKNNKFIIKSNKEDIICDKVVLALGSSASIKDKYNGYSLLSKLGHKIIKPLPALVMLEGMSNYYKDWAGIRIDANVSLYENNKYITREFGEVQLTNYGVSGICVMNLSGRVSRIIDNGNKSCLRINFIPNIENVYEYLEDRNKRLSHLSIIELLESIINYKLLYVILKICKIDSNLKWNELDDSKKRLLVEYLTNFRFDIKDTKGFEFAQVVSGGVSLECINEKFESKVVKDLYILGELLDVDGDCGGYNLGFAFISGLIVGDNL